MRADADVGQILLAVVASGLRHRLVKDVVDRADRDRIVENIAEQFHHATLGTVAVEGQAQNQLLDPRLGHRQMEKHLVFVGLVGTRRLPAKPRRLWRLAGKGISG